MPVKLNQRHLDTHMEQLQQRIKQDSNHQINPRWSWGEGSCSLQLSKIKTKWLEKKLLCWRKLKKFELSFVRHEKMFQLYAVKYTCVCAYTHQIRTKNVSIIAFCRFLLILKLHLNMQILSHELNNGSCKSGQNLAFIMWFCLRNNPMNNQLLKIWASF